ncbi:MAG: hypothetical protein KatS3mg047_1525 [Bellilinea sp.]|nr:MAG: hypothetical protein KatS3mg047_1525 [Bellilinea sp.]
MNEAVCAGAGERPERSERYGCGSGGSGVFGRDGGVALAARAVWVECVLEDGRYADRAWAWGGELYRVD